MKKISPVIWKIAYNMGLLVAGVQIVVGLVWACMNVGLVPAFPETTLLLEISESWVLDEYVGAGYVVLIYLTRGLQKLIGLPYQSVIYLFQFAFAVCGVYKLLGAVSAVADKRAKKGFLVLASLYINTIPFLLQGHFAVLPYSLAGTVYVFLLAYLLDLVLMSYQKTDQKVMLVKLGTIVGCWAISALLMPEYLTLSGAIIVFALLLVGIRQKSWRGFCVAAVAAGVFIGGMALVCTTEEGSRGRVQNTFEAQAMRRFAWSCLDTLEWFWPWDIFIEFEIDELAYCAVEPSRVTEIFGPKVEALFGKETAKQYFGEMAIKAIVHNTKEVVERFAEDYGYYLCPQLMSTYNLAGHGVTYTGQNYGIMQVEGSAIARLLVRWSAVACLAFGMMGATMLVRKRAWTGWLFVVLFSLLSQALCWAWLTAGMISYLACPVNMILWGILLTAWLWATDRKAETE